MKTYLVLVLPILFLIALLLAVSFPYLRMMASITCGLLFLLLLYFILKKEFKIALPFWINFSLFLGISADSIGNAFGFYGRKWGPLWYDNWMHLFIPFCLSFAFFWLLDLLRSQKRLNVGKLFIWVFVLSLTFSLSAFYEVTELWDEVYFGGKRIWGIQDTARDLQWAMIGIISGTLICSTTLKLKRSLKAKNKNES